MLYCTQMIICRICTVKVNIEMWCPIDKSYLLPTLRKVTFNGLSILGCTVHYNVQSAWVRKSTRNIVFAHTDILNVPKRRLWVFFSNTVYSLSSHGQWLQANQYSNPWIFPFRNNSILTNNIPHAEGLIEPNLCTYDKSKNLPNISCSIVNVMKGLLYSCQVLTSLQVWFNSWDGSQLYQQRIFTVQPASVPFNVQGDPGS